MLKFKQLKARRLSLGLSQADVSCKAHIAPEIVALYESGIAPSEVQFDVLGAICRALHLRIRLEA